MKRICIVAFVFLFGAGVAFADEVDEELSNQVTDQLRVSTRQMIRAGIESDDAIKMTRLMLNHHFREEHALRAHAIIMSAQEQGLPVAPIMNKAYEGMSKQVQDRNIVQAMENVRSRYAFAYEQARELTEEKAQMRSLGNTIAKGLAAGVNDNDVGEIMERLQQRTQQMRRAQTIELATETFRTARDMARLGASSKDAADVVCQALKHRYSTKEMKAMRTSFMTRSRTTAPTDLARMYSSAIKQGIGAESLESSSTSGPGSMGGIGGPGSSGHEGGSGHGGGGEHK